ncbi:MAG: DUF2298 domain-containing protein [Gemmatimonadota bacterium]
MPELKTEPAEGRAGSTAPRFWGGVALACAFWLALVLVLQARNPRLVPSWHGFLHTAIADRFPSSSLIPENPFYAGEPVQYYWFYHRIGAGIASLTGIDRLSALHWLTVTGLVLLVVAAALIGRRVYASLGAGLLIGWLALVGLAPLGPGLALARHVVKGQPLMEWPHQEALAETVFTSNAVADRQMSRPLLPALYLSADWRHGVNLAWFIDISSRGLSLAFIMVLLLGLAVPRLTWWRAVLVALCGAMATALNPIMGLAVSGCVGAAAVGVVILERKRGDFKPAMQWALGVAVALIVGIVLSFPTYRQLLVGSGGTSRPNPLGVVPAKFGNMALNFIVLAPLAFLAWSRGRETRTRSLRVMTLAGAMLLVAMLTIHLKEGNDHNLTNAAQVVLAVPAVAWLVLESTGALRARRAAAIRMGVVAALFVPITAATWIAYDGRPPLPFAASGGALRRTPAEHPLARFYQWAIAATPNNATFLTNPFEPVKMSGNVSELPAFTGRTLFVDQPTYMTTPYSDFNQRTAIARRATTGEPLTDQEAAYLRGLHRPLYVVSYHADTPGVLEKLNAEYGPPAFHDGFVACWPRTSLSPSP